MNSALQYAAARHVTVVAASGDEGVIGNGSSTPVKGVTCPLRIRSCSRWAAPA